MLYSVLKNLLLTLLFGVVMIWETVVAICKIFVYEPPPRLRYEPPILNTRYCLILDDTAAQAIIRLQRGYGLKNWAEVYDFAVRYLYWITESKAQGWDAPARRYGSTGEIELLKLPQPDLQVRRRLA